MSRPVVPWELVKLHADLPRKSMRRLTFALPLSLPDQDYLPFAMGGIDSGLEGRDRLVARKGKSLSSKR